MEYILVRLLPSDLADERDVLIFGTSIGRTGKTIMISAGDYRLTLSGDGYAPAAWEGPVACTQLDNPLEIDFRRV